MARTQAPLHEDSGLQPERTALAWGRTMLLLIATSCLFLRWYPYHGVFVASLIGLSLAAALAIWATQRRRYRRGAQAVAGGPLRVELKAIIGLATTVCALGLLGVYCVLWLD